MFLKSLTLKGFKSFAESTTLELEPGVTVVVGPNGSGKSNVVDAIAWVLGAQAPSAVRSQKMDDVIFAGTASRAPLGRAEVRLTIDNSAGILPIDFSEVTVRRTLFRSGDSEYAINEVPCRLLDVQELLSDAGVGRQQHLIVSQGQIDAVLNARPEERRAIIEEAAGVLKFRKRKEKAERRLDATEASLVRVQDLLREVRRQLRPLERQAEAARRHGELIGELTALRIHVAGREIATLRTKLAAVAASKLDTSTGEADLKSRLATLDTDIMAAGAELTARGDDDVGDRLVVVEQLRERARGLGAVIAERRRALERDRGQLLDADVIASLEADAARHADELADVRRRVDDLEPDRVDLELDEQQFTSARKGVLSLFDPAPAATASSAIAEVRGELRSRRAAADRAGNELSRARHRADELAERIAGLDIRAAALQHDCHACELVESPSRSTSSGPRRTCRRRPPSTRHSSPPATPPPGSSRRQTAASTPCARSSTPPTPVPGRRDSAGSTACSAPSSTSCASTMDGSRRSKRRSVRRWRPSWSPIPPARDGRCAPCAARPRPAPCSPSASRRRCRGVRHRAARPCVRTSPPTVLTSADCSTGC